MKTLQTSCQVCRRSVKLEFDPELFSDEWMINGAVCDECICSHDEQDRTRIAKYHKAIERECDEARKPYKD